jgi:hypothetical protein
VTAPIDGRMRDRSVLEEEREFFLRSLRDLESEHAAGDIDPVDYQSLRDDYTRRAADVLRQLAALDGAPVDPGSADPATLERSDDMLAAIEPASPRAPAAADGAVASEVQPEVEGDRPARVGARRRPIFIIAAIALIGAGVGWAVAGLTGSHQSATTRVASLDASGQNKFDGGLASEAYSDFAAALAIDPADPIALTGEGEVFVLASAGHPGKLLDAGLAKLAQAELVDPSYGLAYAWRGVALADNGNPAGAIPQLETYLRDTPTVDKVVLDIRKALADAKAAVAAKKS